MAEKIPLPMLVAITDKNAVQLLTDIVEEKGGMVVSATSTEQLLNRLVESDYALAIAEYLEPMHPRSDSWPVLDILRRFAPHIPTIALSPDRSRITIPPVVATANLGDISELGRLVGQFARQSIGSPPADTRLLRYLGALWSLDSGAALQITSEEMKRGMTLADIYESLLKDALYEVGNWWGAGACMVVEEHAMRAFTQRIMAKLSATVRRNDRNGRKAIVACAPGDQHEIGAMMLADLLEIDGWKVIFSGAATPSSDLAQLAFQEQPDLVCLSCTLPVGQLGLAEAIRKVKDAGDIAVIIGGQAFEKTGGRVLAAKVDADGYAPNAKEAVDLANRLSGPAIGREAA